MFNVSVMGRLCADPQTRMTQSGKSVTGFTIAVNNKRGGEDNTSFVRCSCWEKSGETVAAFFHKGDMIAVSGEGRIRVRDVNGEKHSEFELTVMNWDFCGGRKEAKAAPEPKTDWTAAPVSEAEDLPF